ncbi:hypothetical protein ACHAWF_018717 [Thalassiosira exigua]
MLGSPGGRRRRLIETFVPSNADNNYYTSVHSSSSTTRATFLRRRTQDKRGADVRKYPRAKNAAPTGFRPIDPMGEHGYRITVAKDGSMITAVPIEEEPLRGGDSSFRSPPRPPRTSASPILFSQPRSSPNASVNTSWSTQGLLDARGKQRHKMKRLRPSAKSKTNTTAALIRSDEVPFPRDPFNDVVHAARDKLKHAKGFLEFTGAHHNTSTEQHQRRGTANHPTQHRPQSNSSSPSRTPRVRWNLSPIRQHRRQAQQQVQTRPPSQQIPLPNSGTMEDESFSSFPILSPGHKFDDSFGWEEEKKSSNDSIADNELNSKNQSTANVMHNNEDGSKPPVEVLLQQRMAEIKAQQKELTEKISKKDVIKGTLVSAIDVNLERNRKQLQSLDEELKELQWHLELDSKKRGQQQQETTEKDKEQTLSPGVRLPKSPSCSYDIESVEVGDPSITADTDSVAALFRKDGKVMVTGMDPPARPSPLKKGMEGMLDPPYHRERKEPDGARISSILGGGESIVFSTTSSSGVEANKFDDRLPPALKPNPPPPSSSRPILSAARPPLSHQHPHIPNQRHHLGRTSTLAPPQSQKRGKSVQFNLPPENDDLDEIKFEPSTNRPRTELMDASNDDISWKEEHFDVDAFNEETGSVLSSEHHDIYQWTDKDRHIVVSEHYSRENHHRRHHHEMASEANSSAMPNHHDNSNGNRGISSDSVETDPDLGFIHAVAAVVIQTAVRRFLAEIAVEERRYAVNVIQAAVCNWMARKHNPYFNYGEPFHDRNVQHSDSRFNYEQAFPSSLSQRLPSRTKRVMFEDDYNEFRDFAATEIQRCFRGWWAREILEVDHFAASTIQRIFRGWWARESLDVDRYCAVEIQRIVRGHLSRMAYIYDLYCIIVVQSVARRYLAFYTSAVRLANILYIQAIYRGYRVREELMRYVRNGQEVAATFIQSQWRSYDAQMNYINTLADILIVQSVARRWLVLKKVKPRMRIRPNEEIIGYNKAQRQPKSSRSRNNAAPRNNNSCNNNSHAVWQEHRLNVVSRPVTSDSMAARYSQHSEGFDAFHRDNVGGDEWYDGNKSETSDMLKYWKGRKSK